MVKSFYGLLLFEQHHKSEKDFLLDYIGENKKLMDVLRVIYYQYWLQDDLKDKFGPNLNVIKSFYLPLKHWASRTMGSSIVGCYHWICKYPPFFC